MLTRFAIIQFARADVGQCLAVTFEGSERAGLVVLSADLHLVADDRIADTPFFCSDKEKVAVEFKGSSVPHKISLAPQSGLCQLSLRPTSDT